MPGCNRESQQFAAPDSEPGRLIKVSGLFRFLQGVMSASGAHSLCVAGFRDGFRFQVRFFWLAWRKEAGLPRLVALLF